MIVVVPVDPPAEGLVLASLSERTPLVAEEVTRLYRASVTDVLQAVAASGADLLVCYRDQETLPDGVCVDDPVGAVEELVAASVDDDVRLERQVGSTRSARRGNAVSHLRSTEGFDHVAVLEPTAPLVRRTEIDGAAMAARRHDVVVGPDGTGGAYLGAFGASIDFGGTFEPSTVSRLASAAADADRSVGFVPTVPTVETTPGLRGTIDAVGARQVAELPVPSATADAVDELGLAVDGSGSIVRE